MQKSNLNIIIAVAAIIILGVGISLWLANTPASQPTPAGQVLSTTTTPIQTATTTVTTAAEGPVTTIGSSVQNRPILAYNYGTGSTQILFVGGLHGGYEWNTSLVAYQLMNYLQANPNVIPQNIKVTVIPVAIPDGLSQVVSTTTSIFKASDVSTSKKALIAARFNANTVDLNRNFDCDWQAQGVWQSTPVSGGTGAFSEPESQAIRDYVSSHTLAGVIVWYSSAGGVYSSSCHNGVSDETNALTNAYAKASGYSANDSFDFYATTGDMVNWLAKNNIPAISVLLTDHQNTEWSKNLAGIKAIFKHFSN